MPVTPEQRHVVYSYLLERRLTPYYLNQMEIEQLRGSIPIEARYGYSIVPASETSTIIASELDKLATLEGIAGFYFHGGIWRLNFPRSGGFLLPYFNHTKTIQGLRIYYRIGDERYTLLTSRGLPRGSKAIACREAVYV